MQGPSKKDLFMSLLRLQSPNHSQCFSETTSVNLVVYILNNNLLKRLIYKLNQWMELNCEFVS
jgi:hypothetical protein